MTESMWRIDSSSSIISIFMALFHWKRHGEDGALTELCLKRYLAAVCLYDGPGDKKPEPGAPAHALGGIERLEYLACRISVYADPVVGKPYIDKVPCAGV